MSEVNSQVIYTDIDPDIILQFDDESAEIDLDNSGIPDVFFSKSSKGYIFYWSTSTTGIYRFRHNIFVGGIEIAGTSFTNSGSPFYYPDAMHQGELINDMVSFNGGGQMVSGFYQGEIDPEYWHFGLGHWIFDPDSTYIGARFLGDDACYHYGWVRCSVADSAKKLIIHDYAYDKECENGILAGDTITYVSIDNDINEFPATVYCFGDKICINLLEKTAQATLSIFNISGQGIIHQKLTSNHTEIDVHSFPTGLYFMVLNQDEKSFVQKVNII
ncbi:MAG: T9SS type A sorting domain-containing protein [Chitinophagales bacterium]